MIARLLESREIAPEVRHFVFEVPDLPAFYFVPGQFVSFRETIQGKSITRAYSIASPPIENRFELCLNRVMDGLLSPHLFSLQPGGSVELSGPLGHFTLRHPERDALFIATGTGIAPFRSMVQAYVGQGDSKGFTLVFGIRFEDGVLYGEEFEQLAKGHPNFRFLPTLSRPAEAWQGRKGHVQEHLDEALRGRTDVDVYICGMRVMVDEVRALLKARGFDRKQIVYEKYD